MDAKTHITFGDLATAYCRRFTRSDLQDFLIVPSSWNMDTGIGPAGCDIISAISQNQSTSEIVD
jgi:hypothetical protein